jgi:uncharacterized lipoprotein YbaY/heat shock protein HslJ
MPERVRLVGLTSPMECVLIHHIVAVPACVARRGVAMCLLAAMLACACTSPGPRASATISGTATYRERMALPPDAVFEATLEDVSRADAPSTVVASTRVASPRVPLEFAIPYDPARVDLKRRYAVRGRITLNGQPMFSTDTAYPVLGADNVRRVDLVMRRVAGAGAAAAARQMRGLYRYLADAASFFDCASGDQFPVLPEGAAVALQAAYVAARPEPGAPLLANVQAALVMRALEDGGTPRPALQVDRFVSITAQSLCEAPSSSTATLENTYWRLTNVRGYAVMVADRQREPHLILQPAQHRVAGSGGCNRLAGGYTLAGEHLTFGRTAGTLMACPQGMEQERAFLDALATVATWRIEGQRLDMLDQRGDVVARFVAASLK